MMQIGELSQKTGCNIETIRYYEKVGVLEPADRSPGGYRVYSIEQQKRLGFVRKARSLGFSLSEVRELLHLADGGHTCDEVRATTETHLQGVRARVADLRKIERVLAEMVRNCRDGTVPDCPLVEALYTDRGASKPA